MSFSHSFSGKRILITGGAQGVGRQLVQRFHDDGAVVFTMDKNEEAIEKLQKELPNVTAVAIDLSDWDATKQAVESFGVLDHVVNNAGVLIPQTLMDVTEDVAKLHFSINVLACLNVVQTAAKGMVEKGTMGSIVNLCSIGGKAAIPQISIYSASKSALEMLTKSMAVELGPHNIRANSIAPAQINSPMGHSNDPDIKASQAKLMSRCAIKRPIEPNEIVDLIMFLLSPLSAMITGENVMIDGGALAAFV